MTSTVQASRPARGRASRRRKVGTGIALLVGLFVGLIGFAPSAFAHHPDISATTGCANGKHEITYTATSWASASAAEGRHDKIEISYSLNGGAFQYHATGAFTAANDGTFSGSISLPLSTTGSIVVQATDVGPWENGVAGGNPRQTASLLLKTTCAPPADPSATATVDCPNDEIDLAITGKHAATTVDIYKNGVKVEDDLAVPVGGSSYSIDLVDEDENTTVVIKLDYAVGTDQILNVNVDCDTAAKPTASISWECGENAVVRLRNTGGEPVTATVTRNGTAVHTDISVAPGADFTLPVTISAADEDKDVVIKVTFSDSGPATDVTKTIEVDCTSPTPAVGAPVCAPNGILIPLTNTGTQSVTFTVTSPVLGNPVDVVVGPSGSGSITLQVAEDATTSVSVKVGVQEIYGNQALKRDCEKPAATVTFDCAAGGVVVKLTNAGPNTAIVPVNGENVPVPGNTTTPITRIIEVAEGAAYDVTVLGQRAMGVRDCENPAATVTFDCAAGGVVVKLTNDGVVDTKVDVAGEQVTVPAGTTSANPVVRTIVVAEGAAYDVTVLGQRATGVRDCEKPAATVEFVCAEGGVTVALSNGGSLPTTIKVNGTDHVIAAGGSKRFVVPVAEGDAYSVTVTGGDGLDKTAVGTRDCEKPAVTSAELHCAEGGVVVVLANTGDRDTVVKVGDQTVIVPEHGTKTVAIAVAEGAGYSVKISGDGIDQSVAGTRDCENPAVVSAEVVCAEGGVGVTLSNVGAADTTVTVAGTPVVVPAGSTARVVVPVEENGAYDFLVEGDDLSERVTGTLDCRLPELVVDEVACADGGLEVVLRNTGTDTGTFVVTSPALPGGEVRQTLAAGASTSVLIPMAEDSSTTVKVAAGDAVLYDSAVTRDCEQVEGASVTPQVQAAQAMPRTGSDVTGLLAVATALLLAGLALVASSIRRTTER